MQLFDVTPGLQSSPGTAPDDPPLFGCCPIAYAYHGDNGSQLHTLDNSSGATQTAQPEHRGHHAHQHDSHQDT